MNEVLFLVSILTLLFFSCSLSKSIYFSTSPSSDEFLQLFDNTSSLESLEIIFSKPCEIIILQPIIINLKGNITIKSMLENSLLVLRKEGQFKILENVNFSLVNISLQFEDLYESMTQIINISAYSSFSSSNMGFRNLNINNKNMVFVAGKEANVYFENTILFNCLIGIKDFFLLENCKLELNSFLVNNCSFNNMGLFEGSKTYFFGRAIKILETSFISIEKSVFNSDYSFTLIDFSMESCRLQNVSIFKFYQKINEEELYLFLMNNSFVNIYEIPSGLKVPLILDCNILNGESYLFNLNFENIFTYNYILSLTNSLSKIYIFNLLFTYCYANEGVFIHSTQELYIWNIFFKNQNNDPEIIGNWSKLGSCIFLLSVKRMLIKNITITDSISNITTSGMKLINDFSPLQIKREHLLESLHFISNKVYYRDSINVSCSVLVRGDFNIHIIDSFFKGNELDAYLKSKTKVGGSCVHFYSEKGSLNVEASKFYSNAAKFYSNCIEFYGNILNITTSFFQNNSLIYDELELINYQIFQQSLSRKSQAHTYGYGGAVYSEANYVYLSDNYFLKNLGFEGGGIYMNVFSNSVLVVRIIRCIFLKNEGGNSGGAICFSRLINLDSFLDRNYMNGNEGKFSCIYFGWLNSINSIISNTYFTRNVAEYGASVIIINSKGYFLLTNNTLIENLAKSQPGKINPIICAGFNFLIERRQVIGTVSNNLYIANYAEKVGGILTNSGAIIYESNDTAIFNYVDGDGGVQIITSEGLTIIQDSLFSDSYANHKGGAFACFDFGELRAYNMTIRNSIAGVKGGAFYIFEDTIVEGDNILIETTYSDKGGLIFILDCADSAVIFRDSQFKMNDCKDNLFDVNRGNIYFERCSFFNNSGGIIAAEFSFISISNTSFELTKCEKINDNGCIALLGGKVDFIIEWSDINDLKSYSDGGIIISYFSKVNIKNCYFQKMSVLNGVSLFKIEISSFTVLSSSFYSFNHGLMHLLQTEVYIFDCFLSNLARISEKSKASMISVLSCASITIKTCNFSSYFSSFNGSFIFLKNADLLKSSYYFNLDNSSFISGKSEGNGGAIYVYNYNIYISKCSFDSNSANVGGALFLEASSENSPYKFYLSFLIFSKNKALEGGGAFFWVCMEPILNVIEYDLNEALYGNDFATQVYKMFVKIFFNNGTHWLLEYDSEINENYYIMEGEASGTKFTRKIILKYVDFYNHLVLSVDNQLETIEISDILSIGYPNLSEKVKNHVQILGSNVYQIRKGVLEIEDVIIVANPLSMVFLTFTSSIIPFFSIKIKDCKLYNTCFHSNKGGKYKIALPISFRSCKLGEIYILLLNICFTCGQGEYSLFLEEKKCNKCPKEAFCPGGYQLVLKSGYWRDSIYSSSIYFCFESEESCDGGFNSLCLNEFIGPLCRSCEKGMYDVGGDTCLSCQNAYFNIIRILGFMGFSFVLVLLLIKSSIDNIKVYNQIMEKEEEEDQKTQKKILLKINLQSFYMKIMVNYMQMVVIVNQIPIQKPSYINDFMSSIIYMTSISSKYMGFDCIFNFSLFDDTRPYMRMLSVSSIPLLLAIDSIIFWNILKRCKKTDEISDKIYATLIGIFLMIQPNILEECVRVLLCIEINDRKYLKAQPVFSCDNDIHQSFSYFNWIIFIVWSFFMPLLILYYLYKKRKELYKPTVFKRTSFFYICYKSDFFYWDILIIIRKSFCSLAMLLISADDFLRLLIYLFFISLYCGLLFSKSPFISKELNLLDIFGSIAIIFTLVIIGILYVIQQDFVEFLLFLIIIFINSTFIGFWCFQSLHYMKKVYYEYKEKWFEKMGVKNLKELKEKYLTRKSMNSLRPRKIMISSQVSQSNSLLQRSLNSLVIPSSELIGLNGNK